MIASFMNSHAWISAGVAVPEDLPRLIQTDSRKVTPGQWFVPIVGANHDGHDYIRSALEKGASGFLHAASYKPDADIRARGVAVSDTMKALQDLAAWWRQNMQQCRIVGITGSSGKTSVKELCAAMLEAIGPTLKTEGSFNNELGVPLTLFRLTPGHRFAVIEMGARHKGDIDFLSRIVQQNVGTLINVGTAHVGEFGGTDKILEAKMEIAVAPRNVYLRDDERIHKAMAALGNKDNLSFGCHPEADVRVLSALCDDSGRTHLELSVCGKKRLLDLPYYHQSHALNVAAAITIGLSFGLSVEACEPGLQNFSGVKGRFRVHRQGGFTLVDDAYNANPQSMRAGLDTIRAAFPSAKKVLVLGDMRELGSETEKAHREIGAFCATSIKPELLVTVGDSSRWLQEEARKAGIAAERTLHFNDVDALLAELDGIRKRGDLLYVKASNSLKLSKIIDMLLTA